ncbi:MAG: hypothetical protein QHJ82_08355 [Verrucomicrobiota bacterium]|nr:hypothetical protein [Verrucomicrobiota bacterium]
MDLLAARKVAIVHFPTQPVRRKNPPESFARLRLCGFSWQYLVQINT